MLENVASSLAAASPHPLLLLVALASFVMLDAVLPVLPSETAVVSVAVLASAGTGPAVGWVLLVAATAALAGDLLAYHVGRRGSGVWIRLRQGRTRRGALLRAADGSLGLHGPVLVALARFVAGGRTAVTLSAGASGLPLRRFAFWAGVGAVLWALVFAALGYVGGLALTAHVSVATALGAVAVVAVFVGGALLRRRVLREPPYAQGRPVTQVTG